eukprot:4502859-Pyramimonas_sp.AAC.2
MALQVRVVDLELDLSEATPSEQGASAAGKGRRFLHAHLKAEATFNPLQEQRLFAHLQVRFYKLDEPVQRSRTASSEAKPRKCDATQQGMGEH